MIMMAIPLLLIFFGLDSYHVRKEGFNFHRSKPKIKIQGKLNGLFFLGVIGFVLLSGLWKSNYVLEIGGVQLELQNVIRDLGLVLLGILSFTFTTEIIHKANHFSWEPLKEVGKLFFGIFMTVIPVIAILDAGVHGALSPLVSLVTVEGQPQNGMYFWLSGGLSSFC